MLVLHRSREAAEVRLSRRGSRSAGAVARGMVEDRVAETDQGSTWRSAEAVGLKKLAVAAGNETASGAKQTAQLAAVCMIRPDSAGDPGVEDDGADLVLAGTGLFEVENPKHVHPARDLLRRSQCQWPRSDRKTGTSGQSEEALGRGNAEPPEPIRFNHDGQRRPIPRRVRAGQQQTVFRVAGKSQDQMEAFIRAECRQVARPGQGIEAEFRVGTGWGGYQAHQIDEQLRAPEQEGFIAAKIWVLQDFATPSDGPSRPADAHRPVAQPSWPHRRGNRGCGAGTPMPSRCGRVPSCTGTRPAAA